MLRVTTSDSRESTAPSVFDTAVVPALALLMANIMVYAGTVSFALRPNIGARLLPIAGALFVGAFLGGAIFPRLRTWAMRTGSLARRVVLAVWLLAALAAVLPGFEHYVFNEPLRLFANLFLGMAVAPAYLLFFSRFPAAWRGSFFGGCLGAGLLCWNILISLAYARGWGAIPFISSRRILYSFRRYRHPRGAYRLFTGFASRSHRG